MYRFHALATYIYGNVLSVHTAQCAHQVYQVMENISLMKMNCDMSFKLSSRYFCQVSSCDIDESIKHLQKHFVSTGHNLLVCSSTVEGNLCISSPDKLNTKDSNLQ